MIPGTVPSITILARPVLYWYLCLWYYTEYSTYTKTYITLDQKYSSGVQRTVLLGTVPVNLGTILYCTGTGTVPAAALLKVNNTKLGERKFVNI